MVASAMVADLDAEFGRQGNQGLNPPITRVVPHLFELLFRCSHGEMILNMILSVNRHVTWQLATGIVPLNMPQSREMGN